MPASICTSSMRLLQLLGAGSLLATIGFGHHANANDVTISGDSCIGGLPEMTGGIRPDSTFTLNGVYEYQGETPGGSSYYRRRTGSSVYPVIYLHHSAFHAGWIVTEGGCLQRDFKSWSPDPPLESNPDGHKCINFCGCDSGCTAHTPIPPRSSKWWLFCNNQDTNDQWPVSKTIRTLFPPTENLLKDTDQLLRPPDMARDLSMRSLAARYF